MGSHATPKQPTADRTAGTAASPAAVAPAFAGGNAARAKLFRAARVGAPRLVVAPAGDALEREADRVADAVVRVPAPVADPPAVSAAPAALRTKCAGCEDEELRRDAADAGPAVAPPAVHDVLAGPGRPLDAAARAYFEPRFGADFSGVRVHDGPAASASADAVRARAYTVGGAVVFAAGEYAPDTPAGRHLLAHELAHVVQQGPGLRRAPDDGAGTGSVTLPEITVFGDPHFYDKAKRGNQRAAQAPPLPGWPYDAELKGWWAAGEHNRFADAVRDYQEDVMGDPPDKADGILGRNTATALRAKPRAPAGPTVGDVQKVLSAGAALAVTDPKEDPAGRADYVDRAVVWVGSQGWGNPFMLKRASDPDGAVLPTIPRAWVELAADPLVAGMLTPPPYVYKSRADALTALGAVPGFNVAYYFGPGGFVFPTPMSTRTAPQVVDAMTRLAAQEVADAKALGDLSKDLLWWYVGARFPVRVKSPAPAAGGAAAALAAFSPVERAIIQEAKTILGSRQLRVLWDAYKSGKDVVVKVGGRTIQYEPGLSTSGMTMFGENGFVIGREAFQSQTELSKTVLHELYRLATSQSQTAGISAELAAAETKAAFTFAERAFAAAFQ